VSAEQKAASTTAGEREWLKTWAEAIRAEDPSAPAWGIIRLLAERDALEAEVARLRAALTAVVRSCEYAAFDGPGLQTDRIREIALLAANGLDGAR
jgi:hypothetical protein